MSKEDAIRCGVVSLLAFAARSRDTSATKGMIVDGNDGNWADVVVGLIKAQLPGRAIRVDQVSPAQSKTKWKFSSYKEDWVKNGVYLTAQMSRATTNAVAGMLIALGAAEIKDGKLLITDELANEMIDAYHKQDFSKFKNIGNSVLNMRKSVGFSPAQITALKNKQAGR